MIKILIFIVVLWLLAMLTMYLVRRGTDSAKLSRKERRANQQQRQALIETQQSLQLLAHTTQDPDAQLIAEQAFKALQENLKQKEQTK